MEPVLEKELITSAQQGDEKAFEALIAEARPKLWALLVNQYHLRPEDIDDILQNSMVKVWKKIGMFQSESTFVTWFYVIVRNEVLSFLKKRNAIERREVCAHPTMEEGEEMEDYSRLSVEQTLEETAASLLEKRELMGLYGQMIKDILRQLSPPHRQIIKLAIEQEKTYKQIAKELKIPVGTVMSRLFFARKYAQQLIIQYAKRNSIQLDGMGRR